MPRPLNLRQSYAHRLACRSLYRALLKQCAEFPKASPESLASPSTTVHTLQSLVRYCFQRDRSLESPRAILNGLNTGNKILSLLHQCSLRSPVALGQLGTLLASVSRRADEKAAVVARNDSFWRPPPASRQAHMAHHLHLSRKEVQVATPENPIIFQHPRPLASLHGTVRKVPNYMVTNGIPLLKYPGPQSALMNRVIRQKLRWQVQNFEKIRSMEQQGHLAETEDDWDRIVQEHFGIGEGPDQDGESAAEAQASSGKRPPAIKQQQLQQRQKQKQQQQQGSGQKNGTTSTNTWQRVWTSTVKQLDKAFHARQKQNFEMGRKLYQVLEDERAMRETEQKAAKHERRMARKRAQGLPEHPWDRVDETAAKVDIKREDAE